MATTGYDERVFWVEVSGLRQQHVMPTSHHTFKVPYRLLARTLQSIRRSGGKIVRVDALSLSLPTQQPGNSAPTLDTLDVAAIAAQPAPAVESPPEDALPPENALASGESTQPIVVVETALASPRMVETVPEASKPPGLVSLLLGKLKAIGWMQP